MKFTSYHIKEKQKELSVHRYKLGTKTMVFAYKVFIVLIAFTVVIGTAVGFGAINGIISTAPDITLNDVTPSQYKTTIYDCNGIELETLVASGANRIYATIDEIPQCLQDAFVAIEDERFYEHNGIDPKGIIRAAYKGILNGFKFNQGASTITQQLIKNSVFDAYNEGKIERIRRKIQEQSLAINLEAQVQNKKLILENYLNTINLGNNNLGVQSASINYFNKDVSELTISESAVIAAITQNPSKYNPIRHPENNADRRELVLSNMLTLGFITRDEYNEAMEDDVYSRILDVHSTSGGSKAYSYYTDALIGQIMEDLMTRKGYTYTQAYNLVYRGGLSIHSCEDYELQKYSENLINDQTHWQGIYEYSASIYFQIRDNYGKLSSYGDIGFQKYLKKTYGDEMDLIFDSKEEAEKYVNEYQQYVLSEVGGSIVPESMNITYTIQPQVSIVLIENGTGNVRVLVGGRGDKTESLVLNRATDTKRQAGSTVKPLLVYAPAIDTAGYTLGTVIDDVPFYYDNGKRVKNNDDLYKGYYTLRYALAESRNIPALKAFKDLGISTGMNYMKSYGITSLTENDYYLPAALGTSSITNLEMTAAYTTFANGGVYIEPKLYTKVVDHDGNVILDNTDITSTRVMKESTAWLITDALHTVLTKGTLSWLDVGSRFFSAKSGTTQNNFDKWVIGYGGNYTAGVWMGYDSNIPFPDEIYAAPHAFFWATVLGKANDRAGIECVEPDPPASIVKVNICKDSGLLAVDGLCDCDPRGSRVISEYYVSGTQPTEVCGTHTMVTICEDSGELACDDCPEESRKTVIRIIKDLTGIDLEETPVVDAEWAVTAEDFEENLCPVHSENYEEETEEGEENESPTRDGIDDIANFYPGNGMRSDN